VLHASREPRYGPGRARSAIRQAREAVKVLGLPHEIRDAPDATPLHPPRRVISFESVRFSYLDGGPYSRISTSMSLPVRNSASSAGTGAGKSTIWPCFSGLYEPSTGRVLIDGQNIAKVTQQSLRQSIAVVQQDISLFHRSVLENLRYGKPEASEAEVFRAAENGALHGVHPQPAARLRHHRRRARPQIVGRRTPAPGDCARLPASTRQLSCSTRRRRRSTPIPSS